MSDSPCSISLSSLYWHPLSLTPCVLFFFHQFNRMFHPPLSFGAHRMLSNNPSSDSPRKELCGVTIFTIIEPIQVPIPSGSDLPFHPRHNDSCSVFPTPTLTLLCPDPTTACSLPDLHISSGIPVLPQSSTWYLSICLTQPIITITPYI